jgi:hypothetical protein
MEIFNLPINPFINSLIILSFCYLFYLASRGPKLIIPVDVLRMYAEEKLVNVHSVKADVGLYEKKKYRNSHIEVLLIIKNDENNVLPWVAEMKLSSKDKRYAGFNCEFNERRIDEILTPDNGDIPMGPEEKQELLQVLLKIKNDLR